MALISKERIQVAERRRFLVPCENWLDDGETLANVTATVDSGTATVTVAVSAKHFYYTVSGQSLNDQFNILFKQDTSYGQTIYDHAEFVVGTNGGIAVSGQSGAIMVSIAGPTGAQGPTGPAYTTVLPSGGDDTSALQTALNAGGLVILNGTYNISSQLTLPSNTILDGRNTTTVIPNQARAFVMSGVTGSKVRGIKFDWSSYGGASGFCALLFGATQCEVSQCNFVTGKNSLQVTNASTQCVIKDNIFTDNGSHSISLDNAFDCSVLNNQIARSVGFGIVLQNAAHHNLIQGNYTTQNGVELCGVRYDCHDNRIIGNHAEGTGDNGISVTGEYNVVSGNICRYVRFSGIGLYGSHNSVTGNVCVGNGKTNSYGAGNGSGIILQAAFGGRAQYNSVSGNFCDDDQVSPTQTYGIYVTGTSNYIIWSSGASIPAASYCSNGLNIYFSAAGGTTGATPPTHTSGTVSDGGVSWQYITTYENGSREPLGNEIGSNSIDRFVTAAFNDTTVNQWNGLVTASYMRRYSISGSTGQRYDSDGVTVHLRTWSNGTTYGYGNMILAPVGHVYRCSNGGGSASVAPTHTSGTVTGADGIAWTFMQLNVREYRTQRSTSNNVSIDAPLGLGQTDQPGTFTFVYAGAGDPNGVVSAPKGSIFLRSDGGAGTTLYVRESATLTTWAAK